MNGLFDSLRKWPFLLGAMICYVLVIYEETVTDGTEVVVALTAATVGSVLLGAWITMSVIEFEREWHVRRRVPNDPSGEYPRPDTPEEGT